MERFGSFVARTTLARPKLSLAALLLFGLLAGMLSADLRFDSRFSALLPEDAPEVLETQRLIERIGGTNETVVAISGGDADQRLALGRKVVSTLRGKPWVMRADVEFPADFFLDRRLWLLPLAKLANLRDALRSAVEKAILRASPFFVDLEGDEGTQEKVQASLWKRVDQGKQLKAQGSLLKHRYTSADGSYLFVRVRTRSDVDNLGNGKRVLSRIDAAVAEMIPSNSGLQARLAGGMVVAQDQQRTMTADFRRAALLALVLVIALMTLYVRRLAAPIVLSVPLVLGLTITLAITTLTIGQVNIVTGFLVSALVGLGIDFEIHLYLRYLELLQTVGQRRQAMNQAIRVTLPGCTTAALTTTAAFVALAVSDFRGFREYALIAGVGVLVALVATYLVLPPLAILVSGRPRCAKTTSSEGNLPYDKCLRAVVIGFAAVVGAAFAARSVVWESNFHKLRGISPAAEFSDFVTRSLGGTLSPAAVLVPNLESARKVEAYLDLHKRQPNSLIKRHLSLARMVPDQIDKRKAIIASIRKNLKKALRQPLKASDRRQAQAALKLSNAQPWGIKDVPAVYRSKLETPARDALLVVIWPKRLLHREPDLVAWGRELNELRQALVDRKLIEGVLDHNRVVAPVLSKMRADAPLVLSVAALTVLLVLGLDFRRTGPVLVIAGSLAVGLVWMFGGMALSGLEINVFNQAVLPTIIGLGIDNAVHIQHRYSQEGRGSILRVVRTTGSAAFLATATTAVGFGATITAHHTGVRSLGQLALLGLGAAFISSTLFFPCLLRVLEGKKG